MHIVYGTKTCGYCDQAKSLLRRHGLQWEYVDLKDLDKDDQDELMRIAGVQFRTVPQIFKKESQDIIIDKNFHQKYFNSFIVIIVDEHIG